MSWHRWACNTNSWNSDAQSGLCIHLNEMTMKDDDTAIRLQVMSTKSYGRSLANTQELTAIGINEAAIQKWWNHKANQQTSNTQNKIAIRTWAGNTLWWNSNKHQRDQQLIQWNVHTNWWAFLPGSRLQAWVAHNRNCGTPLPDYAPSNCVFKELATVKIELVWEICSKLNRSLISELLIREHVSRCC